MGAVAVGALLFALFLLIVAVMVLQEARKATEDVPTYVIEEVVPFAYQRLSDDAVARLDRDDVARILEWEVLYLQRPKLVETAGPGPIAGSDESIAFIVEQCRAQGHEFAEVDVAEVVALEAEYLADIGAIGLPVEEPT